MQFYIPCSKSRYFRRSLPTVVEDVTPIKLPRIKPLSPEDKWNEAIWKPKIPQQDRLPSMLVLRNFILIEHIGREGLRF